VLPDGCMDLLFRVGHDRAGVHASIVGTMTTAIVAPPASLRAFVGVRFKPGEAFAFLDLAAADATDEEVSPLDAGLCDLSPMQDSLARTHAREWPALLDRFLLARLSVARPSDARLRGAVDSIASAQGNVRVAGVASSVGFSERQMERVFLERVGISPKSFARVSRVQALVSVLGTQRDLSWAGLAASLGYADQAHLVREVRALTGVTPGALLRERMSDSFNTDATREATLLTLDEGARR